MASNDSMVHPGHDLRRPAPLAPRSGAALRLARFIVACGLVVIQAAGIASPPQGGDSEGVARLLLKIEQLMQAGQPEGYFDLLSAVADRGRAREAAAVLMPPGVTRAVIRERDRLPLEGTLPGDGYRLMLEVFTERGPRARVATWTLDVRRVPTAVNEDEWRIAGQSLQSNVEGLTRLALNPAKQYRARDLVVRSEDIEIRMADGHLFVAETDEGPTAVVMLPGGDSQFVFRPTPETEREQVRLFSGSDAVSGLYDAVFVRIHPSDFGERFPAAALTPEPPSAELLRRADAIFRVEMPKSFGIDLGDLSRDSWTLAPMPGDVLAEIRTRRFQTLTYAKASNEAEDITMFDRRRRRNIAVYPSAAHVAAGGRFFDEDAFEDYDIQHVDLDVSIDPDRQWLEGVARLRLRVKGSSLTNVTLRLSDALTVRSVYSAEFGRLLSLRVRNQDSVVVNLPWMAMPRTDLSLIVTYGGRLDPPPPDREGFDPQFPPEQGPQPDEFRFPGEFNLLYTTNSVWYPQGTVTDYATAVMRLTVPEPYRVLASGDLKPGPPVFVPAQDGRPAGEQYVFEATQPTRYLACLVSRFVRVSTKTVAVAGADGQRQAAPGRQGVFYNELDLMVEANPRQASRGRSIAAAAGDIAAYYASIVGDLPYPSLTIGLIEQERPGGHSPAYLTALNQPLPATPGNWSSDPAAFLNYPDFYIAHEIAHQWWGQAVGWRSYHERWISEGFAQYFAALYARRSRGDDLFGAMMRRMVRWGDDVSDQGPVSLGYRLGHIRGEPRVFRALVYNKSAAVLDMLRRILGDDAFFRGLRRFYVGWRFRKAGTDDVRTAFEQESGLALEGFFESWIHGSGVPALKVSWQRDASAADPTAIVRLEQVGRIFMFPVTVTLRYAGGNTTDLAVTVRDRITETRVPLQGDLRAVEVNRDGLTMVRTVER